MMTTEKETEVQRLRKIIKKLKSKLTDSEDEISRLKAKTCAPNEHTMTTEPMPRVSPTKKVKCLSKKPTKRTKKLKSPKMMTTSTVELYEESSTQERPKTTTESESEILTETDELCTKSSKSNMNC